MAARSSIRFWREKRCLSQRALAEKVGVRSDQMSRFETGNALPTLTQVEALALALDVAPTSLYSETTLHAISEGEAA